MSEQTPPGPPEPAPPPPPPAFPPPFPPPPPAWGPGPFAPPKPSSTRRTVAIAVGAVLIAALVAVLVVLIVDHPSPPAGSNGESTKGASDIVADSADAFDGVTSLHLTGSGTSSGETDVYDLQVGRNGTQGSIVANGAHADVLVIGTDAYMRGRDFFSKFAGAAAGAQIGDRWVHVSTTDPTYGKFFSVMTLSGLRTAIDTIAEQTQLAKGDPTRLDGAMVSPLRALDGELDVALDGTPYPRRLTFHTGDVSADLHFSGFNASPPQPTAPSDVLNAPGAPSA